jgi:hypothetical protein
MIAQMRACDGERVERERDVKSLRMTSTASDGGPAVGFVLSVAFCGSLPRVLDWRTLLPFLPPYSSNLCRRVLATSLDVHVTVGMMGRAGARSTCPSVAAAAARASRLGRRCVSVRATKPA